MVKTIVIKLTKSGNRTSTFSISDDLGNVLASDVPKEQLITGLALSVADSVKVIILSSTGINCCNKQWNIPVTTITTQELAAINYNKLIQHLFGHI
jgi:hypothetical protein